MEPNGYNDAIYDACDEKERMPMDRSMVLGGGGGFVSPETLLRRLARSISTRLVHKRALLEQATTKLNDVQSYSLLVNFIKLTLIWALIITLITYRIALEILRNFDLFTLR